MTHLITRAALIIAITGGLTGGLVSGQDESHDAFRRGAEAAWSARDWKLAAAHYAALVELDPEDGTAWHRLGYARHASGNIDGALLAHRRAAAFAEVRGLALYNVACVHGLRGERDQAFAALADAIAAGFTRADHARVDTDLATLRDDPRFEPMLTAMRESGKARRRSVAVFVHDGVELLDFAGPGEVFTQGTTPDGQGFDVFTVGPTTAPITSQGFLTVTPQYGFEDCPQPDVIVLPGGSTRRALEQTKVLAWLARVAPKVEIVLSVCTGAFIVAEAGLLGDGGQATTHFGALGVLERMVGAERVRRDVRIVDNGKVVTTAGISAGIDGALHVVARLLGEAAAVSAARAMEYRWRLDEIEVGRPGDAVVAATNDVAPATAWICPPCDRPCDALVHAGPGTCEACHMTLEPRR